MRLPTLQPFREQIRGRYDTAFQDTTIHNALNTTQNTILNRLRLPGLLDLIEPRNRQAIDGQLAYVEFLVMLLHSEFAR